MVKGAWQRWPWAEGVTVLRWETSLVPWEHQDSGSETDHSHGLGCEASRHQPSLESSSQPERVGLVSRPGLVSHGRQQGSSSSGCTSHVPGGLQAHSIPREKGVAASISQMGKLSPSDTV